MAYYAVERPEDTVKTGVNVEYRKISYIYIPTGNETMQCDSETNIPEYNIHLHWKSNPTSSDGKFPTAYCNCDATTKSYPLEIIFDKVSGDYHYFYDGRTIRVPNVRITNPLFVIDGNVAYPRSAPGNFEARLVTEAFAKLNDGKVNFGITLAEMAKTSSTITSLAGDVINGLIAIKRRDVKYLKRRFGGPTPSKHLSRRWLQYQYGIAPLLNDIYGAADILNNGLGNSANVFELSVKRSGREQFTDETSDSYFDYVSNVSYNATVRLKAHVSNSDAAAMSLLGLTNPAQVAWELVPFSFVVDWLVPIGTWLQAHDALTGITFEWGTMSLKGTAVTTLSYKGSATVGCYGITGYPPDMSIRYSCFSRYFVNESDIGLFSKNPLSSSHAASTAALLRLLV